MRITQAVLALPKLTKRKWRPYKPDSFMKYARLSVLKDPSVAARAQPERSQSAARAQPERSQSAARAQPERSQSAARAQPERSQSAARAQPERSLVWPLVTIVSGVGCLALAAMGWTAYSKADVVFDRSHEPNWEEVPLDRPTQKLVTINQTYKDIPEVHVIEQIEKEEKH
ncbi:Hypp9192 [Branchiostoma lanceolatum]|uniref:Hypp9192 protein n=1 Tax=Branchiostoma lanceolatum TaxID=7740 RepID=A0A8J9ZDK8_BRALA|nr:Hypp9192 [Branchiostoma lanceolatum]